ncbi:hypothetical protein [Maricaulis sp.]|uniref:hypothetical protein n=1 Tax=Maricaulis sp. TaxID=1486257 RepID=UPI00262DA08B|nr:hypothetical protein [Maricaulis sp.]
MRKTSLARAILSATSLAMLATTTAVQAQGVDPLDARIDSRDAHRFVDVFEAHAGAPTAQALQAGYLDGAGRGVEIFTPGRIGSAERLAEFIAANPEQYRRAIDVCLPLAEASNNDLRAIYLGLAGLLPEYELPEIHVVFGAGNSGGTAGPGAQVLGLEVICAVAQTPEDIRAAYRMFFAHETIHTLQTQDMAVLEIDPLLVASLWEGVPDYIASLVTGLPPSPERDSWAHEREAELWAEFQIDRAALIEAAANGLDMRSPTPEAMAHVQRWLANYRSAPDGWPHEMGYWIGRRISEAYVAQAEDKHAAIRALLHLEDPVGILEASGYAARFEPPFQ